MAKYKGRSYSRTRAKGRASAVKSRNRGVALKVVAVVALVFIVLGALVMFWWLSDGVWGKLPTFTVKTDGHKYSTNKTDVKLYPGTEFEINSFFGKKYTLEIEANADTTDFALTVNGEAKKWSDFKGKDFTSAFSVGRFKNKYTVNYTNLKEVCEAKTSGTVEITDDVQGDIFDVVITCGKREVRLSCYVAPTVKLNPDEIEFDKPGTEKPGTEEPGTEEPGTEKPGTEEPGTEEPGTEEPGTEEPGTEEPGKTPSEGTGEGDKTEEKVNYVLVAENASGLSIQPISEWRGSETVPEGVEYCYQGSFSESASYPFVRAEIVGADGSVLGSPDSFSEYLIFEGVLGGKYFDIIVLKPFDFTLKVILSSESDTKGEIAVQTFRCVYHKDDTGSGGEENGEQV